MIAIVDLPAITTNPVFLAFVFILFVLSVTKIKKIVLNAMWISLAALLFPMLMNRILGFPVPVDANSLIFYLTVGLGAYFFFLLGKAVYMALGIAENIASPVTSGLKSISQKSREKKIDTLLREREKRLEKAAKKGRKTKADDEYVLLKGSEEEETGNKNIIRKFRPAED